MTGGIYIHRLGGFWLAMWEIWGLNFYDEFNLWATQLYTSLHLFFFFKWLLLDTTSCGDDGDVDDYYW